MTMAMMTRVVNFKDYALGTMNLVGRIMSMSTVWFDDYSRKILLVKLFDDML